MDEKVKRIHKLTNLLNEYRDAYYNNAVSLVPDAEFDRLFDELKALENETGITLTNSPTRTVGYDVKSKLEKINHPIPLLSLDKTKDTNELVKFIGSNKCLLMHKYDGATVSLVYNNGKLVQASTRGNGYIGEDITHNAMTFKNIPLTIPYFGLLRLAGEAIIYRDDFQKINDNLSNDEKPYANARNLVAGSIRQLDSSICNERNVNFMPWDVLEGVDDLMLLDYPEMTADSRKNKFAICAKLGFEYPEFVADISRSNILKEIQHMKNQAIQKGIPIDGLVVKYDSISFSKKQGGTAHHNNDGIAFKFEDEIVETTLREIEWSMGRSGQLTPVAIFDPVELDGTMVSRASIHNLSYVKDYDLNIGDKLSIFKANQIIPQISKNVSAAERENKKGVSYPSVCPICGKKTEIKKTNSTEALYCSNPRCEGKKLNKFIHYVSRPAMNIEGLSEATLEKFINNGWLNNFTDIYCLERFSKDIMALEGFGERSYYKLANAIDASRITTLTRLLISLGIPYIGKTAAKSISKYCEGNPTKFAELISSGFDWTQLDDFGAVMSDSLKNWFADDENIRIYYNILEYLDIQIDNSVNINFVSTPFNNKVVVITGSFQNFNRNAIGDKLSELGAKVSSSVSKKTDYVLCGEKAGSKLAKAREFGITILTESDFISMAGMTI